MVSPYLLRPLRSLREYQSGRPLEEPVETVIRRILIKAKAEGEGPHEQINLAVIAALRRSPDMTPLDALAAVHRINRRL